MRRNIYIVLSHTKSPIINVDKNGKKHVVEGKSNVTEKCEFVDSLKRRHADSSTVILDYLNESVYKDRTSTGSYDDYIVYVTNKYPKQMGELNAEYAQYKKGKVEVSSTLE